MNRDVRNAMKSFLAHYRTKDNVYSILKNIKRYVTENSDINQDQIINQIDGYIKESQTRFESLEKIINEYLPYPRFEILNGIYFTMLILVLLSAFFVSLIFFLITLSLNKLNSQTNWWSYGVLDESNDNNDDVPVPYNRRISIQLIILTVEALFIIFFRYTLIILFIWSLINIAIIVPYFIQYAAKLSFNDVREKVKGCHIFIHILHSLIGVYILYSFYFGTYLYSLYYWTSLAIFVLYFINAIKVKSYLGIAFLLGSCIIFGYVFMHPDYYSYFESFNIDGESYFWTVISLIFSAVVFSVIEILIFSIDFPVSSELKRKQIAAASLSMSFMYLLVWLLYEKFPLFFGQFVPFIILFLLVIVIFINILLQIYPSIADKSSDAPAMKVVYVVFNIFTERKNRKLDKYHSKFWILICLIRLISLFSPIYSQWILWFVITMCFFINFLEPKIIVSNLINVLFFYSICECAFFYYYEYEDFANFAMWEVDDYYGLPKWSEDQVRDP